MRRVLISPSCAWRSSSFCYPLRLNSSGGSPDSFTASIRPHQGFLVSLGQQWRYSVRKIRGKDVILSSQPRFLASLVPCGGWAA
jgi:hypothetical protein